MGKSQGWLSRVSGLDIHYISRLVNGKIQTPSIQTALLIAKSLNCLVEDLFMLDFSRYPNMSFREQEKKAHG